MGRGPFTPTFFFAVPRSRYNRGMSRRRTKAQQEKPIAEIKEASAKWNAMSRRKRYVLIAVAVLTVLFSAFVLIASYVQNRSYQAILDYEGPRGMTA